MILTGTIKENGFVETEEGNLFLLPIRGTDKDGFPKVLIDAKLVGGSGEFKAQSIQPYLGMKVEFLSNNGTHGFNFKITN